MPDRPAATLAIGELVARTGVAEGTLRMWERRHGFPAPRRLPSGHRRYAEGDAELVLRVLREREAGLSLAAAIERVRQAAPALEQSIFAGLRRTRPELQPQRLRKPALLALSRAIEDESCARAERPLLFASFQRVRFYRQSERRWREFARTAELAVVFADFGRVRRPSGAPVEVPVERTSPLAREWAVVCHAPGHSICLAGVELTAPRRRADAQREFDVIWSVEPAVVRAAAEVGRGLVRRALPDLAEASGDGFAAPALEEQLRLATAVTARTLRALG